MIPIQTSNRDRRLDENLIKVRQTPAGQFTITLPRGISQYLEVKQGSIVKFEFGGVLQQKQANITKFE